MKNLAEQIDLNGTVDALNRTVDAALEEVSRLRALRAVGILEASDVKAKVTPADRELLRLLNAMGIPALAAFAHKRGAKLSLSAVDGTLEDASIVGEAAIAAKLRLVQAGLMSATAK
jgi:hypothetical protein